MSIKIGILGYGNLGRGVECAVKQNDDMELVAVFTRRNPEDVKILTETAVVCNVADVEDWKDYDSDVIFQMVAGNEKLCPGALLLFHTGAKNMAPALEKLIPKLGTMGYDMVPVGGLFHFSL